MSGSFALGARHGTALWSLDGGSWTTRNGGRCLWCTEDWELQATFIHAEGDLYRGYRDGYQALTDDDPTTLYATEYDTETVRDLRDFHRSNFEQSILVFVLVWGAQVVDAHVDAHLLGFDVSEDLGWMPGVGPTIGFTLSRNVLPRRTSRSK